MIFAGVLGACALGTGLGMWARPTAPNAAPAEAAPAAPRPALQIVMDDAPAPIGQPLEVLPADLAAADAREERQPAPSPPAEMAAPRRAASGLVKVDTAIAVSPMLAPAVRIQPRPVPPAPRAEPKPEASIAKAKLDGVKREKAKLEKAKAETARLDAAKLEKARADKVRLADAKAKKAEQLAASREQQAEKARAQRQARVELARAEKAKADKLAKLDAQHAKARADDQTRKLAALVKSAARKLEAEAQQLKRRKALQVAEAKAQQEKIQKEKMQQAKAQAAARPVMAARRPVPRGEGPVRVARANTCASPDPGEAMVCADHRLGARERQLQQAYRNAEAAGVPASALSRQQARWLQARAAAAREAPWAVEDVYVARISELNDLSRDAREN